MEIAERLDANAVSEVLGLVAIGSRADGLPALGEQTILNLRHGGNAPVAHLLIRDASGTLAGYANVDYSDGQAGAELLVHPMHRHSGHGDELVSALLRDAAAKSAGRINVWAHGDHPSALALAARHDFARARELWQMRRRLPQEQLDTPTVDGVTIRPFVPGRDEQALLEVNNAAFADHPEQGRWTVRDVAMREREDWFDPAGVLLAERDSDGTLLGFHWTKVHGTGEAALGEIYVLGVDPVSQGMKLGNALTIAGLRYLRDRGLQNAMLYVDESNAQAVGMYRKAGFGRWTTDVNYQRELK